jgi:hypothetical protein
MSSLSSPHVAICLDLRLANLQLELQDVSSRCSKPPF